MPTGIQVLWIENTVLAGIKDSASAVYKILHSIYHKTLFSQKNVQNLATSLGQDLLVVKFMPIIPR